ncbi:MAG TPA: hypothetical protein ENH75_07730 [archaeon]|nr:hypothetical protein [archaeon]
MVKIKSVAITLIIFSFIGIIHGVILNSFNVFITWLLIGIWLIYSLKVLKNIKTYRQYNSPHNTVFFTVGPVFIGIFYSIWGNFTGLLGENLLDSGSLYLSWWSILFGLPYVLYGSFALFHCFKKYNVIYFGTKSIKARTFGYILGISILFFIITYWIVFYSIIDFFDPFILPLHFSIDLNLLLLLVIVILIIIIMGLSQTRTQSPRLTRDYITRRIKRVNNLTSPSRKRSPERHRAIVRTTTRTSPTPTNRKVTRSSKSMSRSSRLTPTGQRQSITSKSKRSSQTTTTNRKGKQVRTKQSSVKSVNLAIYKPKAARLSIDDFKCIFCFELPETPKDKGRGIILCPSCRYPAHADEFKDWLQSSGICSRCNATIPSKFKRNPKIISIKNYLAIYKSLLKKK